jgi:hypothetical protein
MRRWSRILAVVFVGAAWLVAQPGWSSEQTETLDTVADEEYPIYDRVIDAKFLTSETTLVLIDRLTVIRLGPEAPPVVQQTYKEQDFFDGRVAPALLQDFLVKLRRPSLLEAKFDFGVRYRLVSPRENRGPDVSLAPIPASAKPIDYTGGIVTLELSRVGFTPREDQALVYVGYFRPGGGGAGFLVLLRRLGRVWEITDTEAVWTQLEE